MVDYFAILGVRRTASDAEIREAYRRLAKIYHPDSNPNDPNGPARMRAINEAKTVLFDPARREAYRLSLTLREKLTAERLSELRAGIRTYPASGYSQSHRSPPTITNVPSKWDAAWRKWLGTVVIVMLVLIIGVTTYEVMRIQTIDPDPVGRIIARHRGHDLAAADTFVRPIDTMYVSRDTLDRLKTHGDLLFHYGEYREAAKFYERYLQAADTTDEHVLTNLSFAYFKLGNYAKSLEVLSKQMHGDSTLVVSYYNIGQLFVKEEKPLDARNAFEASIKVGNEMKSKGRKPPEAYYHARRALATYE